jgi:uncharacterized protein with HEPN domain
MNAKQRQFRAADYVQHILDAIELVNSYVEGMPKIDFLADKRTQQAVILNLIVIGEAATQITDECPEFAATHAHVPWKQMRGMRNRMAHGYFEINLDVVWETVQQSLPELQQQLLEIQRELNEN